MFHSKEKGKIPWNPNMSVWQRVKVFFAGVAVLVVSSNFFFSEVKQVSTFEGYISLGCSAAYMALGFLCISIVFDWRNKIVRRILYGILTVGALVILYKDWAQIWLIAFLFSGVVYIILRRLENIFVTAITFAILFAAVGSILNGVFIYFSGNAALAEYLAFVVYILFYMCVGFWINCKIIEKCCDPSTKDSYTKKHFKNLMSLFYVVAFVILNITTYSHGLDSESFNLLNNSYLTALGFNQLSWENILMIDKSKDMRIIKKGKELKSFLLKDGEK